MSPYMYYNLKILFKPKIAKNTQTYNKNRAEKAIDDFMKDEGKAL